MEPVSTLPLVQLANLALLELNQLEVLAYVLRKFMK